MLGWENDWHWTAAYFLLYTVKREYGMRLNTISSNIFDRNMMLLREAATFFWSLFNALLVCCKVATQQPVVEQKGLQFSFQWMQPATFLPPLPQACRDTCQDGFASFFMHYSLHFNGMQIIISSPVESCNQPTNFFHFISFRLKLSFLSLFLLSSSPVLCDKNANSSGRKQSKSDISS